MVEGSTTIERLLRELMAILGQAYIWMMYAFSRVGSSESKKGAS